MADGLRALDLKAASNLPSRLGKQIHYDYDLVLWRDTMLQTLQRDRSNKYGATPVKRKPKQIGL